GAYTRRMKDWPGLVVSSERDAIEALSGRILNLDNPGARALEIVGEDLHLVFALIFVTDARRREQAGSHEGRRLTNVELFGLVGEGQMPPSATQLGRDRQADNAAANHGDGRPHPAHISLQPLDMVRDHAGASEAQGDSGTAM